MNTHKGILTFLLGWDRVDLDLGSNTDFGVDTTLLSYLRSRFDSKGSKEGCGEGDCGACTILLGELGHNGRMSYKAVNACLVFLPMIHGKQVLTIEHLSSNGKLHPIQKSFSDHHASQCGFCTPGFIMSTMALYKSGVIVNKELALDHLSGNLCRCTGYSPILEAVLDVCNNPQPDIISDHESDTVKFLLSLNSKEYRIEGRTGSYFQPVILKDLLKIKRNNPEAIILCGATDVALKNKKSVGMKPDFIDVSHVAELNEIEITEDFVKIGASCSMNDVRTALPQYLDSIKNIINSFGSFQIRNLASLGGNVASASPIGDLLPILYLLKAKIELVSLKDSRIVDIDKFITGYRKTSIQNDEIIKNVIIENPSEFWFIRSYKISKRRDMDISTVNAAFCVRLIQGKVVYFDAVFGGMAPTIVRPTACITFMMNKYFDRETIEQAAGILYNEFKPISDARASEEGRRMLARNLLFKFFNERNE